MTAAPEARQKNIKTKVILVTHMLALLTQRSSQNCPRDELSSPFQRVLRMPGTGQKIAGQRSFSNIRGPEGLGPSHTSKKFQMHV